MAQLSSIKAFFLVFFLSIGLCLPAVLQAVEPGGLVGEAVKELIVRGEVKSISVSDQALVLSKEKGQRMRFILEQQTVFVGFSHLKDLQPKDRIKVWYRVDAAGNTALKIVKLPELGC